MATSGRLLGVQIEVELALIDLIHWIDLIDLIRVGNRSVPLTVLGPIRLGFQAPGRYRSQGEVSDLRLGRSRPEAP